MYTPLNYSKINLVAGTYTPSTIKQVNNASFNFWERALFQRAISVITIENLIPEWEGSNKDFLWYCLFKFGYVNTFNSMKFGRAFQPCSLNGMDFYYQPTEAIVSNPELRKTFKIHKDCEILKLTPDYMGIWDTITYYANKLSLLDPAIDMTIINSKFSLLWGADSKAGAKFLEKVIDKVNAGEPAVVADTSFLASVNPTTKEDSFKDYSRKDIKATYLGEELLRDFQTILNNFDTEIGIPTIPYQKKERMVTDEANSKQIDATSRSKIWVDTLNQSFELINPMFGSNMKAVHNYVDLEEQPEIEEKGVDENE